MDEICDSVTDSKQNTVITLLHKLKDTDQLVKGFNNTQKNEVSVVICCDNDLEIGAGTLSFTISPLRLCLVGDILWPGTI